MEDEVAALTYIKGLAQFSIKTRQEIDGVVQSQFKQVLKAAAENCDFYKDKRFSFPFLTKEEVRNNIDTGLISNKHLGHPCLVLDNTSGSSGETVPFAYLQGFQRYARMIFSFMINTSWKWGDRYCVLSTVHCSRERCSTNDLPSYVNRVKIPTSNNIFMDQEILDQATRVLRDNQGTVVHADPVYLTAVASYLDGKNERISLKGISSTYELLSSSMKRYLEHCFGCKVFDTYGCSEFGPMAYACEHGGKHLFEASVFIEIIDKGRYLDHEVGEIVVTCLDNQAMPFIRYKTGDLGKLIIGACACQRTAQKIEIYGRSNQCLCIKNVLYTERDIASLMDIPGVLLYQLNQNGGELIFNILLENGYKDHQEQINIRQEIRKAFEGLGVESILVIFVNDIKPEKSGKFKSVSL